jgi:hypothetical protein
MKKLKIRRSIRSLMWATAQAEQFMKEAMADAEAKLQLRSGKKDISIDGIPFYVGGKRVTRDDLECFLLADRELLIFDRYERRALSRRRRAIEILGAIRYIARGHEEQREAHR